MLTFMLTDTRARRTGMGACPRIPPTLKHMGGLGYMHTISSTRGHLDLRPLDWGLADERVHGSLVRFYLRSGKTATCTMGGLLVLRSSRRKRLERHGWTLQAPLAALAAGSAAPLSRAEEGFIMAVVTDPAFQAVQYMQLRHTFPGERAEPVTHAWVRRVAGIRLWLAALRV